MIKSTQTQKKIIKKYQAVYEDLLALKPIPSKMRLEIIKEDVGPYVNVSGFDGSLYGQSEHYCAESQSHMAKVEIPYSLVALEWSKWLGSEIAENTLVIFNPNEISAHCIWEMTFFGITEKMIQANFK